MVSVPAHRLIDLADVKVHEKNVKKHPPKQINNLVQLIKWVGFKDPIVLDKDNVCRAGHGRLLAAKKLGMTQVPYVLLEGLTKQQMDLFIYMDNQVNESPWIEENVQLLLQEIPTEELEVFDVDWDGVRKPEYPEETLPIPEVPVTPKSKLGDIYQLGNHRIMCGDSLNDLDKLLDGVTVDLLLTDPPYGNLKITDKKGDVGNNALRIAIGNNYTKYENEGDFNFKPIYEKLSKHCKKMVIWGGNYFADFLPIRTSWLCWNKRAGAKGLFSDFELAWTNLSTPAKIFNYVWQGMIREGESQKRVHPTQKPVQLFQWIIEEWGKDTKVILDSFLGSGSTLIACEQTNKVCYGMELSPAYIDVIVQRFINFKDSDEDVYLIRDDKKIKWRDL